MEGSGEEHKAYVAGVFGRAAQDYDRVGPPLFAPLGRRLVELAGLPEGGRVLDVACGAGAVTVPAAQAVGPYGHVLGIDLAPEMVRMARRALAEHGLLNAEARVMDGERLDHLPNAAFHAVLCGFSLFFFPDPGRALAEYYRVLRPDGVIGVSAWRDVDDRWDWFPGLLREHGVEPRRLMTRSFDDPDTLAAALTDAGFAEPAVTVDDLEVEVEPEDWWGRLWTQGQRAALEAMDAATLERFRAAVLDRLGQMTGGGPVSRRLQTLYAVARRG